MREEDFLFNGSSALAYLHSNDSMCIIINTGTGSQRRAEPTSAPFSFVFFFVSFHLRHGDKSLDGGWGVGGGGFHRTELEA